MDLNGSLGQRRQPGPLVVPIESEVFGEYGRGEQRYAGDRVQELCEKHAVCFPSMDFPVGDTFFGHRGSSSIDHVAVFQWQ
eukprot:1792075-Pyramimonas_sp.AAC.1